MLLIDKVSHFDWMFTKDGAEGINPPESITAKMLNIKNEQPKKYKSFVNGEEFFKEFYGE